jgi:hypothetical protein
VDSGAPCVRAGEWHRLPVAVKTVVFQGGVDNVHASLVASEAAIATNMKHKNIVATYSHDLRNISEKESIGIEQSVFKFYLLQVPHQRLRTPLLRACASTADMSFASDPVARSLDGCLLAKALLLLATNV